MSRILIRFRLRDFLPDRYADDEENQAYDEEEEEPRIVQAKRIGAQAIFPRKSSVTAREVVAAHKAGLMVGTWTANTKVEMKRLLACGVDAIATNYPDRLCSLME